jgi:hypothetical protein
MGPRVIYLIFVEFTSTLLITTFSLCFGISVVCLWIWYDKVAFYRLVFILPTSWQYEEFWRYPPDYSHVTLSVQTMPEKSILNLLCQPNGSPWSWSYGSWINNYLCNQCLSPLQLWVWIPLMLRCTWYNFMW